MTRRDQAGFTVVEVLVAITVLTVGVLALLQSSAAVTRMLRDGRQRSRAVTIATSRFETLRQVARSTTPTCTALTGGSQSHPDGFTESWTVTINGRGRRVVASVGYPLGTRNGGQTFTTSLVCL